MVSTRGSRYGWHGSLRWQVPRPLCMPSTPMCTSHRPQTQRPALHSGFGPACEYRSTYSHMPLCCKQCQRPLVKQQLSPDKMPVPLVCAGDTSVFTFGKHMGQPFAVAHTNYIKTALHGHGCIDDCCALHRYMARARPHIRIDFQRLPCKCYGFGGARFWSCPVHGFL